MPTTHRVAVVVPIYKSEFTAYESVSFEQCLKVLSKHPIIIVKPQSLNLDLIREKYPHLIFQSFDDVFFAGIEGYNNLLTSRIFYRRFLSYEYILIHQLDAFIFRDDLDKWCGLGYDFIGAPNIGSDETGGLPSEFRMGKKVLLNGGFSLRKVRSCLHFLKMYQLLYRAWVGNEDLLFSLHSTRLFFVSFFLKLPSWRQALPFAFETTPAEAYLINNEQLPLGCHAWERYDIDFWRPIFLERGYTI